MPVLVRNKEAGPTVFSVPEAGIQLEWQGAGDPAGGDVQYVPDDLLKNIQFTKAIRQGIFAVETEADGQASVDAQAEAHQQKREAAAANAAAAIDVTVNNDLVQVECVGPANKGNGTCGEPVAVKEKEAANAPVLCPRHKSLAPQYVLTEADGKPAWVRTTLAPREKQNTPQ